MLLENIYQLIHINIKSVMQFLSILVVICNIYRISITATEKDNYQNTNNRFLLYCTRLAHSHNHMKKNNCFKSNKYSNNGIYHYVNCINVLMCSC